MSAKMSDGRFCGKMEGEHFMPKFRKATKKFVAAVIAGTMLAALPLSGCNDDNKKKENSQAQSSAVSEQTSVPETKFGGDTVAVSENYKVSYQVMQYLYTYVYQSFVSNNGTSMFDSSKSLDEQYYNESENITWHDYFINNTKTYIERILVFAEAAKAAGVSLSDEELKTISDGFSAVESTAKERSMSTEEYIESIYGKGVTKDDIENVQKTTLLAQKYSNSIYDGFKYDDKQYEDHFSKDKTKYLIADYLSYDFPCTKTNEDGTSAVEDEETKKKAKEYADGLANSKNQQEFEDYLRKYLKSNPSLVSVKKESSEASVTEEDFNHAVDDTINYTKHAKTPYSDTSDISKWVFGEGRKENETTVLDKGSSYVVILCTKPAYRDESPTKNVRHILITPDVDSNADDKAKTEANSKAEKKAKDILQEWKDGKANQEFFGELAKKYSEDPSSKDNGGLYKNVQEGQMVDTFNDWLFDKNRKVGDVGIVKTTYGYHDMYYAGEGMTVWKISVDSSLRQDDLNKKFEDFKKKYPVQFDDEAMKSFKLVEQPGLESSAASSGANLADQ